MGGVRYAYGPAGPGYRGSTQYAPLEMYLAGFIGPEEVPDFWTAPDAEVLTVDGEEPTDGSLPGLGRRWLIDAHGHTTYAMDDLLAVYGPRVPASSAAQWHFRAAAIVIGDDATPVSDEHLQAVSDFLADYSRQVIDPNAAEWTASASTK